MIRVLIADDHPIVRHGLREVLNAETGMCVADEAQDTRELLQLLRTKPCDVVLLDISMPGRSGLDVLSDLKKEFPRIPFLVLSIHPEEQFAARAIKAGAAGYVGKESPPDELIGAIRKVYRGGRYIGEKAAEKLAFDLQAPDAERPPHEVLSTREFEVFRMLAGGKSVKECGAELSLSVKTISTYRARVLEKLNLRHNADLTRYALRYELIK